ncbi:MAG: AbrB/MazE/SpoVT family DNA-binding domain-containing protein [Oryzomonas sp.]|uniref:AbrB/MazE/SpoVT family DNA-binding domain-containing protein n=1 Tax=Oryzomonas sp. TaxID=2855186 RepID=UPI00284A26B3|nr:AbrB/MazE/SpoVT family DNA-binding domain-containing protein [Oryzomonas sp.]MDR3579912.1 AbrB/MazE/SpoVT family DNA-binding domain-containing protein [Oryzomonas sp.]
MEARVQKWGHSLALRIPSAFAKHARMQPGSRVDVSEVKGKLVITILEADEPTLEMLLAEVTPDNIHHEIATGVAVGDEAW